MTRAGIQISSVRPFLQTPAGVLASFRKVSAIGYRFIQIQWIAPSVPAEFIRDALRETHLSCVGTQDYTDEVFSRWDETIAQNDLWGGNSICVSGIPERWRSHEGCLALASKLNRRSLRLEERGKVLAFHPRVQDVIQFERQNSLEVLLDAMRPECQWVLDVYHLVKAGLDPLEWIHKVEGRGDLIHFKDQVVHPDGSGVLAPVGQGSTAWEGIFNACDKAGVKVGLAEQETWSKDPFECLKESYDYLVKYGIE